jgi:hypothetical protein
MLQLTLFDLYEAGSSFIVPYTRVAKLVQFYLSTVTSGKTFRIFLTCHLSGRDTGGSSRRFRIIFRALRNCYRKRDTYSSQPTFSTSTDWTFIRIENVSFGKL